MTPSDERTLRAARRTPAFPLIVDCERRGIALRLRDGKVQARPAALLTAEDRGLLRTHLTAVTVLVTHHACWSDWASRTMPRFDPSRVFLAADALQKRTPPPDCPFCSTSLAPERLPCGWWLCRQFHVPPSPRPA